MKQIIYAATALLLGVTACKKNDVTAIDFELVSGAQVKFGYWVARQINVPVQIKLDNQRVSNNLTYAISFPGGGANQGGSNTNDYLSVGIGTKAVSLAFNNIGTSNDSVVLYTGNINFEQGKRYSVMFTDSASVKAAVLLDDFASVTPPNNTTAVCRFFHGLLNTGNVDVYYGSSTTPVFTNVAYNTASSTYALIPIGSSVIAIRPAGSLPTAPVLATFSAAIAGGRVYTAVARGIVGVTGTRAPLISVVTNR